MARFGLTRKECDSSKNWTMELSSLAKFPVMEKTDREKGRAWVLSLIGHFVASKSHHSVHLYLGCDRDVEKILERPAKNYLSQRDCKVSRLQGCVLGEVMQTLHTHGYVFPEAAAPFSQ